jgi:hypothetical protein
MTHSSWGQLNGNGIVKSRTTSHDPVFATTHRSSPLLTSTAQPSVREHTVVSRMPQSMGWRVGDAEGRVVGEVLGGSTDGDNEGASDDAATGLVHASRTRAMTAAMVPSHRRVILPLVTGTLCGVCVLAPVSYERTSSRRFGRLAHWLGHAGEIVFRMELAP